MDIGRVPNGRADVDRVLPVARLAGKYRMGGYGKQMGFVLDRRDAHHWSVHALRLDLGRPSNGALLRPGA